MFRWTKKIIIETSHLQNIDIIVYYKNFKTAIDVKPIIIRHDIIQIKFCVLGVEGTKFYLNNKYNQFLSFLRQK